MRPSSILLVGAGGFLGAIARYLVATFALARFGTGWPWGTFFINLSGCVMIAFFLTFAGERALNEAWRFLFPIGFVGAYTTFSTYSWETMALVERGAWLRAGLYVVGSTVLGLGAIVLGAWLGRRF
jgi:CrcB protein